MILRSILVVIEAASSILLIGIILLQKSKGGGLGMAFGGGAGETLFGSRTGNVLTKGTIILGSVFLVNTVLLAIVYSGAEDNSLMDRYLKKEAGPVAQQRAPAQQMPGQLAAPAGSVAPVAVPNLPVAAPAANVTAPVAPIAPIQTTPEPAAEPSAPDA